MRSAQHEAPKRIIQPQAGVSRRAARVDDNQPEVVRALRAIGAAVTPIHMVGHGVSDLLVSYRQVWFVLEVKDGRKRPGAQKLTEDEREWIARQMAPVHVVHDALEAIAVVNALRK